MRMQTAPNALGSLRWVGPGVPETEFDGFVRATTSMTARIPPACPRISPHRSNPAIATWCPLAAWARAPWTPAISGDEGDIRWPTQSYHFAIMDTEQVHAGGRNTLLFEMWVIGLISLGAVVGGVWILVGLWVADYSKWSIAGAVPLIGAGLFFFFGAISDLNSVRAGTDSVTGEVELQYVPDPPRWRLV